MHSVVMNNIFTTARRGIQSECRTGCHSVRRWAESCWNRRGLEHLSDA